MTVTAPTAIELQLMGYRLATAEILYHLPDHPSLLQSYIWQDYDVAPKYPVLTRFLDFWEANLDGRLHSVKLATSELIKPSEFRAIDGEFRLH